MKEKLSRAVGPVLTVVFFSFALGVIHYQLKKYHYDDVLRELRSIPRQRLALSIILAMANYFVLTGYDTLALRYARRPLRYAKTALASFISYSFSHSIGLSFISGGSMRYHIYSAWGLSAEEIAKVIIFCSATFLLGFLTLEGAAILFEPQLMHAPRFLGAILLALTWAYLMFGAFKKKPFHVRGWEFRIPAPMLSLAQIGISSLDWSLAAATLYVLFPPSPGITFAGFLGIYLIAQIAGFISHVPGGLGVFDTIILVGLSPFLPSSSIFGALLAYRAIYYLFPLAISVVLFGAHEAFQRKEALKRVTVVFGNIVPEIMPHILTFLAFISGTVLLFSGALPAESERLARLKDFLPLPMLEASHFLASLIGAALLILARGLLRRLDAAYFLTIILLAAGMAFSILKGLDYEEAIILLAVLALFVPSRKFFYRKASITTELFTPGWTAPVAIAVICSVWLGVFSYKHLEYSRELWWRFTFESDVSRYLRASLGVAAGMLSFSILKLLSPAQKMPGLPGREDLEQAKKIVEKSPSASANLSLLGDKTILFNQKKNAFIMYGIEGRSWIAMGDPVGPAEEYTELVWSFREMCDLYGGWTVFHGVGEENMPLYSDLDLEFLKLGEEGRVRLETFSLEGGSGEGLGQTLHKLEKEGCAFEVIPAEGLPLLMPRLREISDEWLKNKTTGEKGFSPGFFKEEYMMLHPVAVVRAKGKIVAFANILLGAEKEEMSADLIRYLPGAPDGVMDFLFANIMIMGKKEGYRWFNLGMAPFPGLEEHALAPLFSRAGAFVYCHGEHFDNFHGLRQGKEKFGPEWRPKYLAYPADLSLPSILIDLATLISGGMKGIIAK